MFKYVLKLRIVSHDDELKALYKEAVDKMNTEEYLTNSYQVKKYARVCQLALTDREVVEKVSNAHIKGETFRQIIEIIANNIETKTTDKDIINNLCLAVETEDTDDY